MAWVKTSIRDRMMAASVKEKVQMVVRPAITYSLVKVTIRQEADLEVTELKMFAWCDQDR